MKYCLEADFILDSLVTGLALVINLFDDVSVLGNNLIRRYHELVVPSIRLGMQLFFF